MVCPALFTKHFFLKLFDKLNFAKIKKKSKPNNQIFQGIHLNNKLYCICNGENVNI